MCFILRQNLSSNITILCSSYHIQAYALTDTKIASIGLNGNTIRHSTRLVNPRFLNESMFFWNERAATLETQIIMPIKDHGEMGFSDVDGDLNFSALINKLVSVGYYS